MKKIIITLITVSSAFWMMACSKKDNSTAPPPTYGVCNQYTMDPSSYNECMRVNSGYNNWDQYGNFNYNAFPNNWYSYNLNIDNRDLYQRFLEVEVKCNYNLTGALGIIFGVNELTCDNLMSKAGLVITTRDLTPSTQGHINIVAIANQLGGYWMQYYPQGYQKAFLPMPGTFRQNGNSIEFWGDDIQVIFHGITAFPSNGTVNARVLVNGHQMLSGSLNFSLNGIPYGNSTYLPY